MKRLGSFFFFFPALEFDLSHAEKLLFMYIQMVKCSRKLLYFKSTFPDTVLVLLVLSKGRTFHDDSHLSYRIVRQYLLY